MTDVVPLLGGPRGTAHPLAPSPARRLWHWSAVALLAVLFIVARSPSTPAQPDLPVLGPSRDAGVNDLGDPFVLAATDGTTVRGFVDTDASPEM